MLHQVNRAAWQASNQTGGLWQSRHADVSRWLLGELRRGRRNLTITSLGGSASAWRNNYGFHLASLLKRELVKRGATDVRFFNPSHGYTGSDWGSLYLDSLVPHDTDVLLWEFAINDWPGQGVLRLLNSDWPGLGLKPNTTTTWHAKSLSSSCGVHLHSFRT